MCIRDRSWILLAALLQPTAYRAKETPSENQSPPSPVGMGAGDLLFYFKQFQSFHLGHSLNLLQLVRRIRPPNVVLRRTIIADVINLLYPGKTCLLYTSP